MRIKKVHWLAICLLCVLMAFSAISCADEMPQLEAPPLAIIILIFTRRT